MWSDGRGPTACFHTLRLKVSLSSFLTCAKMNLAAISCKLGRILSRLEFYLTMPWFMESSCARKLIRVIPSGLLLNPISFVTAFEKKNTGNLTQPRLTCKFFSHIRNDCFLVYFFPHPFSHSFSVPFLHYFFWTPRVLLNFELIWMEWNFMKLSSWSWETNLPSNWLLSYLYNT